MKIEIKRSVLFWNILFLIIYISIAVYSFELLIMFWLFCTFLSLFVFGFSGDDLEPEEHLWLFLLPSTYIVAFIFSIIFLLKKNK